MQQLSNTWSSLDATKRAIVMVATLLVFAGLIMLGRGSTSTMSLLYSGLDGAAAGEVVTALEARGVTHEVRGDAIFVDSRQRDRLRLTLASEGLPAGNSKGYELLDTLSGFGTTARMFDAAYWRAKEGELARTIVSSPHIKTARVHISAATARPFQDASGATAAITVSTTSGALSREQAQALRHLVASSVAGLTPDRVSVIDDSGALIAGKTKSPVEANSQLSDSLRLRAERLLTAHVGPGNALVEVSVDTVTEQESIIERRLDPDSRIAISTDTEERTSAAEGTTPGAVTVASNLPEGDTEGNSGQNSNKSSETRALTNYDVSETKREILRQPGDIKRLSVAVLVNQPAEGPRSDEEMQALRNLVASAVGFSEARGDVLTLESMPFVTPPSVGSEPGNLPSMFAGIDAMQLAKLGMIGGIVLLLGLLVVKPILTSGPVEMEAAAEADDDGMDFALGGMDGGLALGMGGDDLDEDPVERLQDMITEREEETIQLLQSWIDSPEETREAS